MDILIVDDEVALLDIMKRNINWTEAGINKDFYAYNTSDARKILFSDNSIGIILCDIEMPQESGLHFLSWVRSTFPDIILLIITGYPDFNYAQKAIDIGVYKYILKPINFIDIVTVVKDITSSYQQRAYTLNGNVGKKSDLNIRRLKKFYSQLVTEDILPFSEFINSAISKYGLTRDEANPQYLIYFKIDGDNQAISEEQIQRETISAGFEAICFTVNNNIYSIPSDYISIRLLKMDLQKLVEDIGIKYMCDCNAYFTAQTSLETLSLNAKALTQAAMQYRNISEHIYDTGSLINETICETSGSSRSGVEIVDAIRGFVRSHVGESIGRKEIEENLHLNGDYINRIFKSSTGYSLIQYIQYYKILEARRMILTNKINKIDFGVIDIAESVGFDNPTYFAKIFHKWTGVSPSEYYR